MNEVLSLTEGREELQKRYLSALRLRAEQETSGGNLANASRLASIVVAQMPRDDITLSGDLGRAWYVLVHVNLALGKIKDAASAADALKVWANRSPVASSHVYAALAIAEVAAAESRIEDTRSAFEHAYALAGEG